MFRISFEKRSKSYVVVNGFSLASQLLCIDMRTMCSGHGEKVGYSYTRMDWDCFIYIDVCSELLLIFEQKADGACLTLFYHGAYQVALCH